MNQSFGVPPTDGSLMDIAFLDKHASDTWEVHRLIKLAL
jgi:hypothetical protein